MNFDKIDKEEYKKQLKYFNDYYGSPFRDGQGTEEILELINTKWNELTDDTEKQQKLARLKEIMHHSQKMYDHFLNTGKEISDSRRGHNYEGID